MIKTLLIVLTTMVASIGGTYFVIGGSAPTEETSHTEEEADDSDSVEVDIDSFSVSNSLAVPGSVIHVSFKLCTTVASGQETTYGELVTKGKQARVRQAIIKVARSASLDDLQDPELTVFRRQIKEEINKVLQKSYVNDVIIASFRTMEQ
jgi:flagellar basal body-associated protein FliL